MNEVSAYRWLRNEVAVARLGDRLDRLENLVGAGMPDVNGCFNGSEFWIEVKAPTEPKRASTPLFGSNHKLSQEQKNWIKRQQMANGRVHIFIATDQRKILIDGKHAEKINEMTLAEIIGLSMWHCSGRAYMDAKEALRDALVAGF